MVNYLSVSKAAKLVGASRRELQAKIRSGELQTFEGELAWGTLLEAYPAMELESNAQLERVLHIQRHAASTSNTANSISTVQSLRMELHRTRHKLNTTEHELMQYKRLSKQLQLRLTHLQSECSHKQKVILHSLLVWMNTQVKRIH